jgi:choline dehydrogenase-like flavoprotein
MKDIDGREIPKGKIINTDVCIIGGGAAGISIAQEFLSANSSVIVLESGDYNYREQTQSLYDFVNIGHPMRSQQGYISRNRYLGGTTNTWHGRCAPLDPIDFTKRSWIPDSGWPISYDDIEPFYKKACKVLQIPEFDSFNFSNWSKYIYDYKSNMFDGSINADVYTLADSPIQMRTKYAPLLTESSNIQIILNSNVTEIESDENQSFVKKLIVATLEGNTFFVKAKYFVLTCGGWENARLLLVSRRYNSNGLANDHDIVGRYYMEHPKIRRGKIIPSSKVFKSQIMLWKRRLNKKGYLRLAFKLSENAQKENKLHNHSIELIYPHSWLESVAASEAILRKLGFSHSAIHKLVKISPQIFGLLEKIEIAQIKMPLQSEYVSLFNHMEQTPNPESRVMLDNEKDALGVQKLKVKLLISDHEKESMIKFHDIFGNYIKDGDYGTFVSDLPNIREPWDGITDSSHHIGTTRMCENPKKGVVDDNCQVHGINNLFIASSSVFPTGGHANPTFSIVAISLRVADYLKSIVSK